MADVRKHIIVEVEGEVGIITINRPKVLNAINHEVISEIVDALTEFDGNDNVHVMVLTGNQKAFAAGADIGEMSSEGTVSILLKDQFATWDKIRLIKKPIIAAVSGYALGGGCELAMACDMIVASESAQFGQPEINLGIMPGAGGTQRLTRAVGKYKAMEMILTGAMVSANEAKAIGLVNRVAPVELYLETAKSLAQEIAKKSPLAVRLAKDAVLKSFDVPIVEGIEFERKNFYMLFSSQDQKEGMKAFLEKRQPAFSGR
jgi:enoyl-CoA hydratase